METFDPETIFQKYGLTSDDVVFASSLWFINWINHYDLPRSTPYDFPQALTAYSGSQSFSLVVRGADLPLDAPRDQYYEYRVTICGDQPCVFYPSNIAKEIDDHVPYVERCNRVVEQRRVVFFLMYEVYSICRNGFDEVTSVIFSHHRPAINRVDRFFAALSDKSDNDYRTVINAHRVPFPLSQPLDWNA